VAVLSTALALIPTILLTDVSESRLALFGVAVMVSAWYGGWKPGVVATAFALTVSAYFTLANEHSPAQLRTAIIRLSLFFFVAMLICWLNAALRAAQENLRRSELNFRSLVTNAPYGICRCDSTGKILDANPAFVELLGHASAEDLIGQHVFGLYADTTSGSISPTSCAGSSFQRPDRGMEAKNGMTTACAFPRSVANGPEGMVFELFAEDVTERRALEQQLRQCRRWKRGPARGRHRPRFQQSSDGNFGLLGIPARTSRGRASTAWSRPGDCPRRRTRLIAHTANCWPSAASRCWLLGW